MCVHVRAGMHTHVVDGRAVQAQVLSPLQHLPPTSYVVPPSSYLAAQAITLFHELSACASYFLPPASYILHPASCILPCCLGAHPLP